MGEPTESVHVAAGNSRAMDSSVIVIQANGKPLVGALLVQYSRRSSRIMPTCLDLDRVLLL
jgi:hypothetical protein